MGVIDLSKLTDGQRDALCSRLGACGCIGDGALALLIEALDTDYTTRPEISVARLVLERQGLAEHGVSIRGTWPTRKGHRLLAVLGRLGVLGPPPPPEPTHAQGYLTGVTPW